ncbi:hypothetical protein C5Y96_13815 [Blastopirellula marina]|uniref:Uncharacterized protein n=1 Tax=Blastopirellula marina TaxID=124 RepID=A0A2S8FGV5_9BACT|nr:MULTISPECIES: hypothetical protein [Pirellulaceae]PQO31411.1 hypothetical protein C5Y96_13815 [Blastopirellula marina]RCS51804.1 hypothetical protein DTL36_13825 [Bremerella cremea]
MESSSRFPWWVLITAQGLCAVGLLAGIVALVSPFWFPAGVIGFFDGYERETDVLGIVWLAGSLGSMFIGVLLIGASALGAIWTGIAVGIGGLAMRKIPVNSTDEETDLEKRASD